MTHYDTVEKLASVEDLFAAHAWCKKQLPRATMLLRATSACLLLVIVGRVVSSFLINQVSLALWVLALSTVSGLLGVSLGWLALRVSRQISHKQDQVDEYLDSIGVYASADMLPVSLPKSGVFWLMLFLPKKVREPLLGDLEEEYQEVREQFGKCSANFWFYKQVLTSLWPMLQTTGRTLAKWGLLGWLEEFIRRIAH